MGLRIMLGRYTPEKYSLAIKTKMQTKTEKNWTRTSKIVISKTLQTKKPHVRKRPSMKNYQQEIATGTD